MRQMRYGAVVVLRLLAAGLIWLMAGVALAGTAGSFASNGDLINGWRWLRDPGLSHYAEYRFDAAPKGDVMLEITVLATDRVNGGGGVNAHFDLLVGWPGSGQMNGVFVKTGVTLQNAGPAADPNGYLCHGFITLPRARIDKVMPANGALFVRIVRESHDPHVAFRADSVKLVSGDMLGDLLGGLLGDLPGGTEGGLDLQELLDLLQNGGTEGPDGGTLGDHQMGEGLRGELDGTLSGDGTIVIERGGEGTGGAEGLMDLARGDHGDEGVCWYDRPCIGMGADGFRSTGLAGVEGWFWLRAPTQGQYADWVFEHPPGGALVLDIAGYAQTDPTRTPTDTAHVRMTLGYPGSGSLGGQVGPVTIPLPMLWQDPGDDSWKARGLVTIPAALAEDVIGLTGGLYLHIERVDGFEPDVGFSAGSVLLYPAAEIAR